MFYLRAFGVQDVISSVTLDFFSYLRNLLPFAPDFGALWCNIVYGRTYRKFGETVLASLIKASGS